MRNKKFYDNDHAVRYLTGSLVSFDGNPVYIQKVFNVGRYLKANFLDTYHGEVHSSLLTNPKWDFNPVPLGFTSYVDNEHCLSTSLYIVRQPRRMWKIGLASNNMTAYRASILDQRGIPDYEAILISQELARTIKGEFFSLKDAHEMSMGEKIAVAFSRRFCVENGFIFYKWLGIPVGRTDGDNVKLFGEFTYLEQVLSEDLAA